MNDDERKLNAAIRGLYRRQLLADMIIQERVDFRRSLSEVCEDLGMTVDELCDKISDTVTAPTEDDIIDAGTNLSCVFDGRE